MDKEKVPKGYVPMMFLLGTLLFLEWIYPTQQIADTTNISVFVLFTLFCMALTMAKIPSWFANLLKGMAILFIVHTLFMDAPFLSLEWILIIYEDITMNYDRVMEGDFLSYTSIFRTVSFLILIMFMVYLIHYWFVTVRKFFLFILLTMIYLSIIDTFTAYDASWAMIRSFVYSFIALGYSNLFKQTFDQPVKVQSKRGNLAWKLPVFVIVLAVSLLSYALPKFAPQWPDPIPFIQSMSDHASFPSDKDDKKKMGLSEDDSRLGGSFTDSEKLVFEAYSGQQRYWRVDSKDFYTGQGWIYSEERDSTPLNRGTLQLDIYAPEVEYSIQHAVISFAEEEFFNKIPYPYEPALLHAETDWVLSESSYNDLGAIEVPEEHMDRIQEYGVTYLNPEIDMEYLREIDIQEDGPYALGPKSYTSYTQLPTNLPERISDLTEEIIAPYENDYDRIKAIEQHFHTSGFRYETEDVPYPDEDEDYVDQFLFETKYGYCDNFSTSMVVMLRSAGYPTRWVKGYTAGELVDRNVSYSEYQERLGLQQAEQLLNKYEIRNANAHSWVEVFFPEVGWVPFEPTQGFSNYVDFDAPEYEDEEILEAEPEDEEDEEVEEEPEIPELEEDKDEEAPVVTAEKGSKKVLYISLGVLAGLLFLAYVFRVRLRFIYYRYRLSRGPSVKTYEQAFIYLLDQLDRRGMEKRVDETLRDYAKRIDYRFDVEEMAELTHIYEQLLYREAKNINHYKMSQLWENMMKRVIA